MTLLFLLFAALVTWSAWNLYHPVYRHAPMPVVSFFSGFVTGELALHVMFWQAWIVAFFAVTGAITGLAGATGLLAIALSWLALARFYAGGAAAGDEMQAALQQALGDNWLGKIPVTVRGKFPRGPDTTLIRHPFRLRDPHVDLKKDIPYGTHGQHLDIRRRHGDYRGAPVLLQIHGGAWTEKMGSKNEQALPLMNHLAKQGWVSVAISYRLSPTHTLPDHLVDCKQAIAWIRDHIEAYGGDPEFIAVTGGSAGGHLAAMVALTANDATFQPGFEDVDTTVQAAVPFYGPMDFTDERSLHPNSGMLDYLETTVIKRSLTGNERLYRSLSPMHRVHRRAPPFLVIHGDCDTLVPVDEGRAFSDRLREVSGKPVAFACIEGAQHAFDLLPSLRSEYVKLGVSQFLAWCHAGHTRRKTARKSTAETAN